MAWFRVDDSFYDHPKLEGVSMAARGLWLTAGTYCARHLTDGVISARQVRILGGTKAQIRALTEAGLWKRFETESGVDSYAFHDWLDMQPSRKEILNRRADDAERKREARERKAAELAKQKNVRPDVRPDSDEMSDGLSALPGPARPGPAPSSSTEVESTSTETFDTETGAGDPPGPKVPIDGWKLVREHTPANLGQAVRTGLSIKAAELLHAGTPETDVRACLDLWMTKREAGVGLLPHLLGEVVKTRDHHQPAIGAVTRSLHESQRLLDKYGGTNTTQELMKELEQ